MGERAKQVVDGLVAQVIADLERADLGKWEMPWRKGLGHPINPATDKRFNGANVLILLYTAQANNYKTNRWATLRQWAKLRAKVKKGSKATFVLRPKPTRGQMDFFESRAPFWVYWVFNQDQTTYRDNQPDLFKQPEKVTSAEDYVANTKVLIHHGGDRAYFTVSPDEIHMPPAMAFMGSSSSSSTETYYATLLHELVHWSGHPTRLKRDFTGKFGAEAYAVEELVAELGSAFLCSLLGVAPALRKDHSQYIKSWIALLKHDTRTLLSAASLASKAVAYLDQMQCSDTNDSCNPSPETKPESAPRERLRRRRSLPALNTVRQALA